MNQREQTPDGPRRICLLLGGETGERQVSITSGAAFGAALIRRGCSVLFLDPATGRQELVEGAKGLEGLADRFNAETPSAGRFLASLMQIPRERTDVVAILLHGGAGEGGPVQMVLELLGLSYTGSGPASSAVALDKVLAKRVMQAVGIPVAEELHWRVPEVPAPDAALPVPPPSLAELAPLGGYPVVVKPVSGGSTVGVTIVENEAQWQEAWRVAHGQIDPTRGLLVERYIPGRELTVGILGEEALPVVEIVPKTGFYDYRRKYTKGETEYRVPAPLPEETAARIRQLALDAFRALDCKDLARVDFRLEPSGKAVCLEVNTIPGMTATSLVPMAAGAVGVSFDDLAGFLCARAWSRRKGSL